MHSLLATSSLPPQQSQPTTGRHSSNQGQLVAGRTLPNVYRFVCGSQDLQQICIRQCVQGGSHVGLWLK